MSGPPLTPHIESEQSRLVYRVGHSPDPWPWTPREYVQASGRWDDPTKAYRVLYVGDSIYACLVEVLAQFRPDVVIVDELADLLEDPEDAGYPTAPAGQVTRRWLSKRSVGTARMTGRFVEVCHSDTLAWMRRNLGLLLHSHEIEELDASVMQVAKPRSFTQAVSKFFYEFTDLDGERLDGVGFLSRWGHDLQLWAIFERSEGGGELSPALSEVIHEFLDEFSADVQQAIALLELIVVP